VLTARPRVKPQPIWRLRAERVATAASLVAVAVVMLFAVVDWEAPYKVVAKPLEGRIHIGKDEDEAAAAVQKAKPAAPSSTASSEAH
jgi:hypothetical protein